MVPLVMVLFRKGRAVCKFGKTSFSENQGRLLQKCMARRSLVGGTLAHEDTIAEEKG